MEALSINQGCFGGCVCGTCIFHLRPVHHPSLTTSAGSSLLGPKGGEKGVTRASWVEGLHDARKIREKVGFSKEVHTIL